jgi:hypothetical protein
MPGSGVMKGAKGSLPQGMSQLNCHWVNQVPSLHSPHLHHPTDQATTTTMQSSNTYTVMILTMSQRFNPYTQTASSKVLQIKSSKSTFKTTQIGACLPAPVGHFAAIHTTVCNFWTATNAVYQIGFVRFFVFLYINKSLLSAISLKKMKELTADCSLPLLPHNVSW